MELGTTCTLRRPAVDLDGVQWCHGGTTYLTGQSLIDTDGTSNVITRIEELWSVMRWRYDFLEMGADLKRRDDTPLSIDLIRHLLRQCPNAKVDEFTLKKHHIADFDGTGEKTNPSYDLVMTILPRVKTLHVEIVCSGLTRKILREVLVAANVRCLEDLTISVLIPESWIFLRLAGFDSSWNDADYSGDTGSAGSTWSVITVRPKRFHIDINNDYIGIKVLQLFGPACSQVKSLEIAWLTEPLARSFADTIGEYMPHLASVVLGFDLTPDNMLKLGAWQCRVLNVAQLILEACSGGLVSFEAKHTVEVDPTLWTALLEHTLTLENVTLRKYDGCDVVRLLRTCPRLKTLVAGNFDPGYQAPVVWVKEADFTDADPESDGELRPWPCEQSLRSLSIYLNCGSPEYPRQDWKKRRKVRDGDAATRTFPKAKIFGVAIRLFLVCQKS
ncbi:hypothetical protein BG004_003004 [Podila humilis]|nr:hypothetical protein BG004_003004 [Podila humilis]